jgi:hypothetical protein
MGASGFAAAGAPVVIGSNDECAVATLGGYVLLLWRKRVAPQGVVWLRTAFDSVLRERRGEKLAFLTITEDGCELTTSPEVRRDIADLLRKHQQDLAAAAIVFEEQGFRMTMVRSVITAIYIAARIRFPNSVFADVESACTWLERHHGSVATDVLRTVRMIRTALAR